MRPYLQAVGPHDAEGRPVAYPGSPAIAQTLMRAQDRIALCEANPDEREALIAALGRDRRLSIVGTDGYVALNAYLPPKERRGVVLIDPPFEAPGEAGGIVHALERALRKWPTGTYVAWRPIRDARADARFLNAVAALGAPNILRLELDIGPGPIGAHGQEPLTRAGLLIVNPPHTLDRRSADAAAVAGANARSRRRRKASLRLGDGAEVNALRPRPCPRRLIRFMCERLHGS